MFTTFISSQAILGLNPGFTIYELCNLSKLHNFSKSKFPHLKIEDNKCLPFRVAMHLK